MKIIDFEKKGNMVKFYVGSDNCTNYWGDDWDDRPYEHNAGSVYSDFILGYFVKSFGFDDIVMEPSDGAYGGNSSYSKDDMKKRKVPCICVLPQEHREQWTWYCSFDDIAHNQNAIKYYFEDIVDETKEDIIYYKDIESEHYYVQFTFDANIKIKRTIANMLGSSLKTMSNDVRGRNFDDAMYNKIEDLTTNKFKSIIKYLIKSTYKMYKLEDLDIALDSLTVKISNYRTLKPIEVDFDNNETMNVCCWSNDNFRIGSVLEK